MKNKKEKNCVLSVFVLFLTTDSKNTSLSKLRELVMDREAMDRRAAGHVVAKSQT